MVLVVVLYNSQSKMVNNKISTGTMLVYINAHIYLVDYKTSSTF